MSERNMINLFKASDKAAKAQVQHLVLALTPDGKIQMNGSDNMIDGLLGHPVLLEQLKSTMIASKQDVTAPMVVLDYPLLPCSPYSAKWKGSKMIRGVLTKMLARAGYGRSGRNQALGAGAPPHGWPESIIPWASYCGATRSRLTTEDVTTIIISMLRVANIDEKTHIVKENMKETDGYGNMMETEDLEDENEENPLDENDEETGVNTKEVEDVENNNVHMPMGDIIFSGDIVIETTDDKAETIQATLVPDLKKRNIGVD